MSDSSSIVEFSLVTHASDSPHMHIVLQYLFSALGNPKLCSCLFVCLSIFSCLPRSYSCVVARNLRYPLEPLVDHRPAKKKTQRDMVRRKLTWVGVRG